MNIHQTIIHSAHVYWALEELEEAMELLDILDLDNWMHLMVARVAGLRDAEEEDLSNV